MFYRKPISNTLAEAEEIIALAKEYNVKGQVGHVERFTRIYCHQKHD
jgi:predicted dehydrogenase